MKAMILAAGLGLRLRPLTEHTPKALVPVAGRPMIEYPLLLLRSAGIRQVIVNVSHLAGQIEDYLGNGAKLGLRIEYSREPDPLDTGGAVLKAKPFLADGPFIVINSDVIIDLPLEELVAFHARRGAIATLVLRPDQKAEEYGAIECAEDGKIYRFLEARATDTAPTVSKKRMFTGLQIVDPALFAFMEEGQAFSLTRTTYTRVVRECRPLYGFDYFGFWQDLGTAARIAEVDKKLAAGEVKLRYCPT